MELSINNGICVTLSPEDFTNLLKVSNYFNPKSQNFQYFFLREHLYFPVDDPVPSFRILLELANNPNSYKLPPHTDVTALLRLAGYILFNEELLTASILRSSNILQYSSSSIYAAYNHQFHRSIDIQFLRLGINPVTGRHHLQTEQNYRNFRLKLRDYSKLNKYFVANIVPNCHCPACAEFKIKNLCFDIPHSPTELANWPHRNRNGSGYGNFLRPINQPW